jgi:predicted N-acetyltransferase YhbS
LSDVNHHLIFREAIASDAKVLESLLRQLVDNDKVAVLPEQLDNIKSRQDNFVFVVEQGQNLLGMIQLTICPDIMFKKQPYAVLENIIVSAQAQGLGVGQLLMKAVESMCLERDCSKIMLLSAVTRSKAHGFFEANGYSGNIKKGFVKYRKSFVNQRLSSSLTG